MTGPKRADDAHVSFICTDKRQFAVLPHAGVARLSAFVAFDGKHLGVGAYRRLDPPFVLLNRSALLNSFTTVRADSRAQSCMRDEEFVANRGTTAAFACWRHRFVRLGVFCEA